MYLVEVIPLTKIPQQKPQILSYFSSSKLNEGSFIFVPLGRRQEKAVVMETHEIKDHKLEIKDAEYELRPIKKILVMEPVLTPQQIKLALWLGQYYFASPGLFLKMMRPGKISNFNRQAPGQKLILFPTVAQLKLNSNNYPKNKTAIIHSGLSQKLFNENWQKIARGETPIILGTRLACFVPFFNLKEIFIFDETNASHRSWDMFPHYRSHEVAKKLAEIFQAELTLEAKIPSVETFYFAEKKSLNLKSGLKNFPETNPELIDLRQELKNGNYSIFSQRLQEAIRDTLKKNQQVILFINRRGAATFVLCRDCGYVAKCPNCDAPLTYHLTKTGANELKPLLICHHCGHQSAPPTLCPSCQGHRIKAFGTGTQRVEIEAKKIFKDARILRLDSDVAREIEEQNKILADFRQKKAEILIGTQMLLDGDLPKVALAAIISADTLLHLPDFQSDEKTFQTINAVKNLTGSRLIIQTYNPKSEILRIASEQDINSFYKNEIGTRKILKYPPFSQLIKLRFGHKDGKFAAQQAKILSAKLTQQLKNSKILNDAVLEISDAVPAFISKEKGRYIWQIILKARSPWLAEKDGRQKIIDLRNKILLVVPPNWEIDIDPETLL
jgi:primosomal protein N' (replication factor Y)